MPQKKGSEAFRRHVSLVVVAVAATIASIASALSANTDALNSSEILLAHFSAGAFGILAAIAFVLLWAKVYQHKGRDFSANMIIALLGSPLLAFLSWFSLQTSLNSVGVASSWVGLICAAFGFFTALIVMIGYNFSPKFRLEVEGILKLKE